MAIRKVEAPKSLKTGQIPSPPPAAPAPGAGVDGARALVDRALQNGTFSQDEARALDQAVAQDPSLRAPVAEHLKAALERAAGPVAITDAALAQVSRALGVDVKDLFFATQARSTTVTRDVSSGLALKAQTVADTHSTVKHKAASDTRLQSQRAILDGRAGVVDRPIGGSKGAAYDAAQVLASHVATQAEAKLDARLSDEARAAKDVLREPIVRTGQQVMAEAMKNPDTMKALGDVASLVGKPGFSDALAQAALSVGKHVVDATNLTAVNAEAVQAAVQGVTAGADKLVKAAGALKNPAVEAAVARQAPKVAEGVARLGAKLTQGAASTTAAASAAASTAAASAAAAAKATTAVAGAAKAATAAGSVAAGAAAGAAQTAGAAVKTGAQSVPVVGQALGVVTTGMAACEFVGACRTSPREWKRVAAAGLNVVGQAAGIFIPFVGAASTGLKLATDAAMDARDKKLGKEPTPGFKLADVAPHVGEASALASTFLDGAGHGDAAARLRGYAERVDVLAQRGMGSAELAALPAAERDALFQTLSACSGEAEALAREARGTPNEAAALLLGEATRGLAASWRKSRTLDTAENPDADKRKLAGEAMEAVAKAATASAVVDAAAGAAAARGAG